MGKILVFLSHVTSLFSNFPLTSLNIATSIGSPTAFPFIFNNELHPNKILKVSSLLSKALLGSTEFVCTIPLIINSSFVKVPVLSKQQISILPANGIRKGSIQTILLD